jgi:hypothetical protein
MLLTMMMLLLRRRTEETPTKKQDQSPRRDVTCCRCCLYIFLVPARYGRKRRLGPDVSNWRRSRQSQGHRLAATRRALASVEQRSSSLGLSLSWELCSIPRGRNARIPRSESRQLHGRRACRWLRRRPAPVQLVPDPRQDCPLAGRGAPRLACF